MAKMSTLCWSETVPQGIDDLSPLLHRKKSVIPETCETLIKAASKSAETHASTRYDSKGSKQTLFGVPAQAREMTKLWYTSQK